MACSKRCLAVAVLLAATCMLSGSADKGGTSSGWTATRRAVTCADGVDGECALDALGSMNLLQHGATHAKKQGAVLQRTKRRAVTLGRAPSSKPSADKVRAPLAKALVDEVYTYGAPATHKPALRNAAAEDGCFPGLRSYTEDLLGAFSEIHQVDAASMNNWYPHAWINTVCLHWDTDSYYVPCKGNVTDGDDAGQHGHWDWPLHGAQVYEEWRLHHEEHYAPRLDRVTNNGEKVADQEPFLSARKFLDFAFRAYDTPAVIKKDLKNKLPDWHIVLQEVYETKWDRDPVHVIQNWKTLDCAFVFTGTNNIADLPSSTTQYGTGYCGFQNTHVGYRNELWTITYHLWGKVRPALEQCQKVICVGHSLGGALCEIFAACANSGNYTDPDYQLLAWDKAKNPTKMAELDG